MIEQLIIINFQCHKKLVLDLSRGITTLVGRNDVGKSAVLRALRWLCLNKPAGVDYIRHGSPKTVVRLHVDGRKIERKRSKGLNKYLLDDQGFVAFGNTVPEDIAKCLNVGEVNFQHQMDAPFWLHLAPGQVTKELNKIVDLREMDAANTKAQARVRAATTELSASEDKLIRRKELAEELKWVPRARKEFKAVQEADKRREELLERKVLLEDLYDAASDLQTRVEELGQMLNDARPLKRLTPRVTNARKRLQAIKAVVSRGEFVARQLAVETEREKQLTKQFKDKASDRCPTCLRPLNATLLEKLMSSS